MGGTGATFVIPILLILFAKSKQLKAVGFASYIPIWFQVNEPALFGCPLILNPIVMIPFMILPIINVVIYKFFIETLGMNGAIVDVPWSMPAAIVGLLLGTSFQWQAVVLWGILCLVDFICWLPFVLLMDRLTCTEEIKSAQEKGIPKPMHFNYFTLARLRLGAKLDLNKEKRLLFTNQLAEFTTEIKTERANNKAAKIEAKKALIAQNQQFKAEKLAAKKAGVKFNKNLVVEQSQPVSQPLTRDQYHVLIVCYGAGTSAMFAASANKGAASRGIKNIVIDSAAYGSHRNLMKEMDLVVLSPQVNVYIDEIERDASAWKVKIVETKGKQYIDCTNNPDQAIDLILANLPDYNLETN
ncbi:PTS transporter subunit EIIC [Spiroplasma eriocheiris]|uniref:PTS transporter subunit EIIC n=1 Tax=Spiroplasma eriocheiris TaxID=315358 RepID=UPI00202A158D|nr:PTS transporter subunit EIIC [Spiroplasma eriocheiris]